jgi:hypothetical protein
VRAPRVHFEGGIVYHEPGLEPERIGMGDSPARTAVGDSGVGETGGGETTGAGETGGGGHARERELVRFHDLNLFFGGVQAVQRRDGELLGAGDPRRGGVAVVA